jgi:hypothetical protein
MFFEKMGRFLTTRLRPAFLFAALLLPLAAALLFLFLQLTEWQELQERLFKAAKKEKIAFERKERKERFLKRFSEVDPYFLDQKLAVFPLLVEEKQHLQSLLLHPAFPHHPILQDRLSFIEENHLTFKEENLQTNATLKEAEEKLRHPVQMDEKDLERLLSLLEDISIGDSHPASDSPQLIIRDFKMGKRKTPLQTQVFEVEMNLLKREFTKS